MKRNKPKPKKRVRPPPSADRPCCGLCGKAGNLTRTECCGNWICNDEHKYVMFSYARNSCHRNHDRYTLCAFHFHEGHEGLWQDCEKCRQNFETEMYVWYATNEFNFEKLANPPAYEPTHCAGCGRVIRLGEEGHTYNGASDQYFCGRCTVASDPQLAKLFREGLSG